MIKMEYLRFRKGDLLAVVMVVVLAVMVAVCFLPKDSSGTAVAEIYRDGELVKTLPLDEDTTLEIRGQYANTVTVENGKVAITASDCPGEDCVHSGAIHTAGRSVVCLPNGVEVRVTGQSSDVDFVVG